jgi:hypothetical protein
MEDSYLLHLIWSRRLKVLHPRGTYLKALARLMVSTNRLIEPLALAMLAPRGLSEAFLLICPTKEWTVNPTFGNLFQRKG